MGQIDNFPIFTKLNSSHVIKNCRGFPVGSVVKNLPSNAANAGSILGLGRSPREASGYPLQYSCLGNLIAGYSPWGQKRESDFT